MYKRGTTANRYHLPIKFNVKYQPFYIAIIIYFNLCIAAAWYLFLFYKPISTDDIKSGLLLPIILIGVFSCLVLILNIDFIHSALLHSQFVEISHVGITVKKLFRKIELKWNEIYLVDLNTFRMAKVIRITEKKHKDVGKFLFAIGKGFGFYYIGINQRKYSTIDINKFINTIIIHT